MTFNSLPYALFLPVVVCVYWLLPARAHLPGYPAVRWRQCWLLAVSYVFYAAFDSRFALLLGFTTAVDYTVAHALDGPFSDRSDGARKRLLIVSVGVNLTVLGFFKYFGFFVEQASALMERAGFSSASFGLRVLLPYGISFYTFQSIGYAVDVYRRKVPACRNPLDFATFVAFFPAIVAGPISRARDLLPQIQAERPRPNSDHVTSGLLLILLGLVKKVVLADPMAPVVAEAFGMPDPAASTVAIGVLAFAVQIYGDFSGYTDMARGSARLLGVDLVHNFEQPYLSASITEFWRRWHISLSTWLRDYLYVPLGGNRGTARRTYRNLMLTMVLGGLWHGAAWTFVAWGVLHGLYLCVERAVHLKVGPAGPGLPALRQVPRVLFTFGLVCLAWIPFRAASGAQALDMVTALFRRGGQALDAHDVTLVAVLAGSTLALDLAQRSIMQPMRLLDRYPLISGSLAGAALVALVVFSGGSPVPFIYFQF